MPISFDRNVLTESFEQVFFCDPKVWNLGRVDLGVLWSRDSGFLEVLLVQNGHYDGSYRTFS